MRTMLLASLMVAACHDDDDRHTYLWQQGPSQWIHIPAGIAQDVECSCELPISKDWVDPCPPWTSPMWVDEFDIMEFPVVDADYGERANATLRDVSPFLSLMTPDEIGTASAFCAALGLELPTTAELVRAARESRTTYDWGARWAEYPVCTIWRPAKLLCTWTSRTGVVFPLTLRGFAGEWATMPYCPGVHEGPTTLVGDRYVPPYGMFRCVRHTKTRNP